MWMRFTRQQLLRAFVHPFRRFRSQTTAMVQEKLKGTQAGSLKLRRRKKQLRKRELRFFTIELALGVSLSAFSWFLVLSDYRDECVALITDVLSRLYIEAEKFWSLSSSLQTLLTSFQAFQALPNPNQSFQ